MDDRRIPPRLDEWFGGGNVRRILVVNPDRNEGLGTAQDIQQLGHLVACVQEASEAIDLLTRDHFDLVVVEWPYGQDVLRHLETVDPSRTNPRVIVLAAPPTIEQVLEAYQYGGDMVFTKPAAREIWQEILKDPDFLPPP